MSEQSVFPDFINQKDLVVEFKEENTSSDGGLLLFNGIEKKLSLASGFASCLNDYRDFRYVKHTLSSILSQRMYQFAGGYDEVIASDKLNNDPTLKILCHDKNQRLSGSSTQNRIENNISISELHNIEEYKADIYLKRNNKRLKKMVKKGFPLVIDLDPTHIITHGNQQLSLFNGYYGSSCYLPMVICDGENGDLISSILRPGTKHATFLLPCILKRLFQKIEEEHPKIKFKIRADSGFQSSSFFKYLDSKSNVKYMISLISNSNLLQSVEGFLKKARQKFKEKKETVLVFKEFMYKSKSWDKPKRVIAQIEINSHREKIRFLATNIKNQRPKQLKEDLNQRAGIENKIKELKNHLCPNLSCSSFKANYFRLCVASFAFILFQELKKKIPDVKMSKSYVETLRNKLIKIAVKIKITTRKIWCSFPKSYPYQDLWKDILLAT